jgi:SAM-dependent methyltransferase
VSADLQLMLHADARHLDPTLFETPEACWAYAVSCPVAQLRGDARQRLVVVADVEVSEGVVGVGCTNAAGDAFLEERFAAPGDTSVTLRTSDPARQLVFRNANGTGRSRFRIKSLVVRREAIVEPVYPVRVQPRQVANESVPPLGDTVVFNNEAAAAINVARMDFITSLDLPLSGRRVLDVGCGVGHFAHFYSGLGATVVGIDGRADNIDEMRRRYPEVEGRVGDLQSMNLEDLGRFDLVHAFGLLYHLDSPVAALRRMEAVCGDLLLLETMVCDSPLPLMMLADETMAVNQALAGVGCRPTPSFVVLALNRVGFPFVYGASTPPRHPDFDFEWRGGLDVGRDGHNLRCVFVASRRRLALPGLTPLLES